MNENLQSCSLQSYLIHQEQGSGQRLRLHQQGPGQDSINSVNVDASPKIQIISNKNKKKNKEKKKAFT